MALSRREWLAGVAAAQVGLAAGPTSSEGMTRACLEQIRRLNPSINAFITALESQALSDARERDREARAGRRRGPLHGIPIALKDNIDTAGVRTTAAAQLFRDRVPDQDATVAARLKAAGAVLLGKTNLDEWAFEGTGTTSYFGVVHNPWKLDRITGGSSAGSAAAVITGMCHGSVGSDDGGSIRIPGSHCGVVGLKPSYGRVSTRGIVPSAYSLDCAAPIAATVGEAATILQVIAGDDPADAITVHAPVPDYTTAVRQSATITRTLRVGVPRAGYFENLHPDTESAVEAAIGLLRKHARSITDVVLPRFQRVEGGSVDVELFHYHKAMFEAHPEQYHPWSREQLEDLKSVTAERYVETLKRIREARRDVRALFDRVDLLLLPTMREPAPEIDGIVNRTHKRPLSNVAQFNYLGLPAMTVPCGFSREGLPIGLQIVGPYLGEERVLAVGAAYEALTDWHSRKP